MKRTARQVVSLTKAHVFLARDKLKRLGSECLLSQTLHRPAQHFAAQLGHYNIRMQAGKLLDAGNTKLNATVQCGIQLIREDGLSTLILQASLLHILSARTTLH